MLAYEASRLETSSGCRSHYIEKICAKILVEILDVRGSQGSFEMTDQQLALVTSGFVSGEAGMLCRLDIREHERSRCIGEAASLSCQIEYVSKLQIDLEPRGTIQEPN